MNKSRNTGEDDFLDVYGQVGQWLEATAAYRSLRMQILRESRLAGRRLAETAVSLPHSEPRWTLLPLPDSASVLLAARARLRQITAPDSRTAAFTEILCESGARAYRDAGVLPEVRRSIRRQHAEAGTGADFAPPQRALRQGEIAADFLRRLCARGRQIGFDAQAVDFENLRRTPPPADPADALNPKFALAALFSAEDSEEGIDALNLSRPQFQDFYKIISKLSEITHELQRCREECVNAAEALRERLTLDRLRDMPLNRLKDAGSERLKLGKIAGLGINTVGELYALGGKIRSLPGIGSATAENLSAALHALKRDVFTQTPVRLRPESLDRSETELLRAVYRWDTLREAVGHRSALSFAAGIKPRSYQLTFHARHLIVIGRSATAHSFLDLLGECRDLARNYSRIAADVRERREKIGDETLKTQFRKNPAHFYAQLAELGILTSDAKKIRGDLPLQIAQKVQSTALNTDALKANLRGYQRFGAQFILTQGKVILGDEMGLGKTVEALAAAAHLHGRKTAHTLVVCPAAVVTNWLREIEGKTSLNGLSLHGTRREEQARQWMEKGGVAVTTYETLGWFLPLFEGSFLPKHVSLDCAVIDEAHYIKNPETKRARRTGFILNNARYAALLTGTPMENRTEEFRALIRYIQPGLALRASTLPRSFRAQIAPVYLRRRQEDVLAELPELLEYEEWLPLGAQDREIYEAAVKDGNFMAMRRAALCDPDSVKLARIRQITEEAAANGRKVLIYSYFLQTLSLLHRAFPTAVGVLSGAVDAEKRQRMVDDFTQKDEAQILLAQINAGGVGLNIQAAGVVIICEPQLKPTVEWQAVARAHRMGRAESVQVFRLISETGIDARIHRMLQEKTAQFGDFAAQSETAAAARQNLIAAERRRIGAEKDEKENGRTYAETNPPPEEQ